MGIQWKSTTQGPLKKQFQDLRDTMRDPRGAFDEMLDYTARRQRDWFSKEGYGWPGLSPQYASWKRRQPGGDGRILVGPNLEPSKTWPEGHEGGQLIEDLTQRPFGYESISRKGFIYGTHLPYAEYHRDGAGRLPVRDPLRPIDATARDRYTAILTKRLLRGE